MTPRDEAHAWLEAAGDPAVAALLESIYADVATEVARRSPACWASGRCCNFDAWGHRLYVTGLEAAYTVSRLESPLTGIALAEAWAGGGCPFQVRNLCGIHAIKPLACRVYFCDRSAQAWQQELSERLHERVKLLHVTHGVPYRYAEWRSLLELFIEGP